MVHHDPASAWQKPSNLVCFILTFTGSHKMLWLLCGSLLFSHFSCTYAYSTPLGLLIMEPGLIPPQAFPQCLASPRSLPFRQPKHSLHS